MDNTWGRNLKINKMLKEQYMTPEEDEEFMKNIDMDEVERGIEQAEREIANGQVIELEEAFTIIRNEVLGEEL